MRDKVSSSVIYRPHLYLLKRLSGSTFLSNLRQYANWFIIRSLSRSHPDTLNDAVKAIGGQINEIQIKIDELFKLGITSRLIKDGPSTIAIYDEDGFREYCEKKMRDILEYT